jgi:hypothetical protein
VLQSTWSGNTEGAIMVEADGNLILGNTMHDSTVGLLVHGQGNWLVRNTSRGIGIDGKDEHGDCTHNRWINNDFGRADPDCILAPFPLGPDRLVRSE